MRGPRARFCCLLFVLSTFPTQVYAWYQDEFVKEKSQPRAIENTVAKKEREKIVFAKSSEVHTKKNSKYCGECHGEGERSKDNLLGQYPKEYYLEYDITKFELCFYCHSKSLIEDETTSTVTNFRDKRKNLHRVHVVSKRGRSCSVCHDPHGSTQESLIKTSVDGFGRWSIPINFKKESNGATCIVGCHKPKNYVR